MPSACVVFSNTGACSSEGARQARRPPLGGALGRGRVRGLRFPAAGDMSTLATRVEEHIRRHELIEPGQEVVCLVSGGADSTCLFHVLKELGYSVSALHVDHGLRGAESDADARWCAERFGAEVVQAAARCETEAA